MRRPGPREAETCRDVVVPALATAGWGGDAVFPQYSLKAQRVMALGGVSRDLGDGFVDYVLEATPGTPVAVVEAKRAYRTAADGVQQALRYAQQLDVPLAYATNGHDIIECNLRTGVQRNVEGFMAPAAAWAEYAQLHHLDAAGAALIAQPFNRGRLSVDGDVLAPRYYQVTAINRVLSAIATGSRRVLLLMATGTGKTFTAMQIVAKLRSYEAVARPDRNYRVLYLADRDALLKQPQNKDFLPAFGKEVLHRVLGQADQTREIYFASYQALTGAGEESTVFADFRPDYFDLVIVDECHRGSAAANSAWRAVLDHITSAVHLGLTATPRDDSVNSYEYFGNPVFKYSLRQGIEDGYLAPYRVRRVTLSPDADGWEPSPGEVDRFGREIPEGTYGTRDFERVVSLLARTELAAHHLSGLLRQEPDGRCIVFCVDTDHADAMRKALANANPDLVRRDPEWVVRIVGIEGEKERLLDDFCNTSKSSPVVATTSRLLSTGVDVEDLRFVVLFRPVGSMVEFKQIIGRGTRLYDGGPRPKSSFEVVDYVGASTKFDDQAFDGYPTNIVEDVVDDGGDTVSSVEVPLPATPDETAAASPDETDCTAPGPHVEEPQPPFTVGNPPSLPDPRRKLYVDSGDFTVEAEARLVPDTSTGHLRLTTYGAFVRDRIADLGDADDVTRRWAHVDTRHALIETLAEQGIEVDELLSSAGLSEGDPLDALLQLAWNQPGRTRAERVRGVRERHAAELAVASAMARSILEGLLERYERHGISDLEDGNVFRLPPLAELGSPVELANGMGGGEELRHQLDLVQEWLYSA